MTTAHSTTAASTATAASSVRYPDVALDGTARATPELERLTRQTAGLRDEVTLAAQDTAALHHQAVNLTLSDRAARINLNSTLASTLEQLADAGMSWAEIAAVADVTPAAVRKWRRGGEAAGPKRMAVAALKALLEMLEELTVAEPVAYLISPVVPETTVTVLDVFRAGRHDLVLDLASQRKSASTVLDEFQPGWRTEAARRFTVQVDDDGERALVPFSQWA